MTLTDPETYYGVVVGEPYLYRDYNGNYCILQDEHIFGTDDGGNVDSMYANEVILDPNPSEAKIFKYILKGGVREAITHKT